MPLLSARWQRCCAGRANKSNRANYGLLEKIMKLKSFGTMGVDWEQRVDYERLRTERLARVKRMLKESEIGSLLCFDQNNIRYVTNTTIGSWAIDKLGRFCLLPQDDNPINWDFGSAAKHHTLYAPWLGEG